ncbi:MAG: ATP synthase subunit C [Spirochaetota bacterium]
MEGHREQFRRKVVSSIIFTLSIVLMLAAIPVAGAFAQETTETAPPTAEEADMAKWGFMAAALAFGFGALGAGIGIANVGAAAMGAVSEKPEIAGQALIFIALAEGLVVFGFITALIILGRI